MNASYQVVHNPPSVTCHVTFKCVVPDGQAPDSFALSGKNGVRDSRDVAPGAGGGTHKDRHRLRVPFHL